MEDVICFEDLLCKYAVNLSNTKSTSERVAESGGMTCSSLRCKTRRHGDCGIVVGTWCKAFNQERSGKRRTVVS